MTDFSRVESFLNFKGKISFEGSIWYEVLDSVNGVTRFV